jgi:hypothetical protein
VVVDGGGLVMLVVESRRNFAGRIREIRWCGLATLTSYALVRVGTRRRFYRSLRAAELQLLLLQTPQSRDSTHACNRAAESN